MKLSTGGILVPAIIDGLNMVRGRVICQIPKTAPVVGTLDVFGKTTLGRQKHFSFFLFLK